MEYFDLYKQFNPKHFNADVWMKWFKENGMKMFAFTTKHLDGFSMYDTKTVVKEKINWTAPGGIKVEPCDLSFDIMDSPFKRDIVKELCESAHKHDIKIDQYYSHIDWFDADQRGFATKFPNKELFGADAAKNNPGMPAFTDIELKRGMKRERDQLIELISN